MATAPLPGDRSSQAPAAANANFIFTALHETGGLAVAAIAADRLRDLRREGAAMTMDEAVAYALAHIDPKLLTGPIASIEP
jgi:hypothetical protein